MEEEQDVRSDSGSMARVDSSGASTGSRVESVPSDQLWRAAVLAARQAAITAAELRRAFDGCASCPPGTVVLEGGPSPATVHPPGAPLAS